MTVRQTNLKPLLLAGLVLLLGCAISAGLAWRMSALNQQTIDDELQQRAERITADVVSRIELYQYGLRGARGAVVTSGEDLSRELFNRYSLSRDIDIEFPGARGFGFIRRVPAAEETAFLQHARDDGYPAFRLHQLQPHDGERFIIQYIEPEDRNEGVVGLDIASESNRRNAAMAALRSGEVRLTAPITLIQATGHPQQSFLILMPVYNGVVVPATVAEREKQGYGWSYAPLLTEEVLAHLALDSSVIHLNLLDVTDEGNRALVFHSDEKYSRAASADEEYSNTEYANNEHVGMPPFVRNQRITRELYGRRWLFEFGAYPAFVRSLGLLKAQTVFGIGTLISALGALIVLVMNKSRRLLRQSTYQRERMASVVESSPDAIVSCDAHGNITSWNRAAEHMFGFAASEAIGASVSRLIIPEGLVEEEASLQAQLQTLLPAPNFITKRQNKFGHQLDVSIAAAPIVDEGEFAGYSKTIRDISDEIAAQEQIKAMNQGLEALVVQRTHQLEDSQLTMQNILDNVPSYIGYWDADMRSILLNKHFCERIGYSAAEAQGRHYRELVGDAADEITWPTIRAALDTGEPSVSELSRTDERGRTHYVLLQVVPEKTNGTVSGIYTLSQNISELRENRQRLELVLRENEALLATINEQMLYSVTNIDGDIIDANENFCLASGYRREELIGKNHRLLNSGVHDKAFWAAMWATVSAGQPWHGEVCNQSKDGSRRWFDSVIAPFSGADGRIERYVALRSDITDKRVAEAERNEVNRMLSYLLDAASDVSIIATDNTGLITIFNTGAENMLGYSAAEMVGNQSPAAIHVESEIAVRSTELSEQFGETIEGFDVFVYLARQQGSDTHEWTYRRKDGGELRVSLAVTALRDSQEEIIGYLGIAIDITEKERSRRALLSARDQLITAAEVARLGIWSWNLEENRLQWNERMFEIYQLSPSLQDSGLIQNYWRERVHPDDAEDTEANLHAIVAHDGTIVADPVFRIILPSGEIRHIQTGAQVERDSHGSVIKVTGVNRDITEQLDLEQTLRDAKESADSSNAAKSAFLANMSHEIRTPMNAVLGMLQLMRQTDLDSRQRDYVSKAGIAAKSLLDLLNDILDFSKIEQAKLTLEAHPFDLEELLRNLGVVLSGYQGEKPVELMFDIDPALPGRLVGDRLRLQQILLNLGGNALKFTEQGQVVIRLQQLSCDHRRVDVRVAVADSGIGIDNAQLERIFESFTQAEASTTRRFGGSGLGLVICKRLVDLMGGELQVDSEPGTGSRFWFDISLEVADDNAFPAASELESISIGNDQPGDRETRHKETPNPASANDQTVIQEVDSNASVNTKPSSILVVDDNTLVAEILAATLSRFGYRVNIAHSAYAALTEIQAADEACEGYDIVLMDWLLPDFSGEKAAERIAHSALSAVPKVILLTAHAHEFARAALPTHTAYYSGLLTKPITPLQLNEAIRSVLEGLPMSLEDGVATPVRGSALRGLQVLVVEDNALNRQIAAELLRADGAMVELAVNGAEGTEKVLQRSAPYDLVIMDIQMPEMDGLEATRRIRADGRFADLPILAMTANASAADRAECLAAGMNDHVGKPIDIEQLLPLVLRWTRNRESARDMTSVTPVHCESARQLLGRFNGNVKLLQGIQPKFYPSVKELVGDLQAARNHNDHNAATAALHSIKGTASTLGAISLAESAASWEQRVRDSNDATLATILAPPCIEQLLALADFSDKELALLVEELSQPEIKPTNNGVLSTAAFTVQLRKIMPMLDANNLSAIEQIESLYSAGSAEQQEQLNVLMGQITALEFAAARATLEKILQEN